MFRVYTIHHHDPDEHDPKDSWYLFDQDELNKKLTDEEKGKISANFEGFQRGFLGDFETVYALAKALLDYQERMDKTTEEATPQPAPADPGPRPGGIRDTALQKIK